MKHIKKRHGDSSISLQINDGFGSCRNNILAKFRDREIIACPAAACPLITCPPDNCDLRALAFPFASAPLPFSDVFRVASRAFSGSFGAFGEMGMDGARLSDPGNSTDDLRSGRRPRASLPNRLAPRRTVTCPNRPAVRMAAGPGEREHRLAERHGRRWRRRPSCAGRVLPVRRRPQLRDPSWMRRSRRRGFRNQGELSQANFVIF